MEKQYQAKFDKFSVIHYQLETAKLSKNEKIENRQFLNLVFCWELDISSGLLTSVPRSDAKADRFAAIANLWKNNEIYRNEKRFLLHNQLPTAYNIYCSALLADPALASIENLQNILPYFWRKLESTKRMVVI